jgi:hypothetical protein
MSGNATYQQVDLLSGAICFVHSLWSPDRRSSANEAMGAP